MTQSPDEKVSEGIVAELRDRQLIATSRMDDLAKKLVAGSLTSADWRRIAEASLDEEQQAEDGQPN